jgi:hypothetical protein
LAKGDIGFFDWTCWVVVTLVTAKIVVIPKMQKEFNALYLP